MELQTFFILFLAGTAIIGCLCFCVYGLRQERMSVDDCPAPHSEATVQELASEQADVPSVDNTMALCLEKRCVMDSTLHSSNMTECMAHCSLCGNCKPSCEKICKEKYE